MNRWHGNRREQVQVRMPLEEVAGGRDGDDDTGMQLGPSVSADQLDNSLRSRLSELLQQLSPASKQWPQQARDGEDHVTMRDRCEELGAQRFRPEELFLLLA